MIKMTRLRWLMLILLGLAMQGYAITTDLASSIPKPLPSSDHYQNGRFQNLAPQETPGFKKMMGVLKRYASEERIDSVPTKPLPIQQITRAQLDALDDKQLHLVKLGHSSVLIKVYGRYWLIDPVFSERASPFSFMGPKRFHPTPISIGELPEIDKVLITHNHYDHLDKAAIEQLANKTKQFLTPLGIEGDLQRWGVDSKKILSFDWWQEYQLDDTLFAFTPTQHFSGRSLNDRNKTLWGSWVIKTAEESLYFSGDSGYFDGFKTIGKKYGPFDVTFIENGAYNRDWSGIHMYPEDAVVAHKELKGVTMIPIHHGTFDLSFHSWYDPLDRVYNAAQKEQVSLSTPIVGEIFTAKAPAIQNQWWKEYK